MTSSEREKSQIPYKENIFLPMYRWAHEEQKDLSDLVFSIVVGTKLVLLIIDKPNAKEPKIRSFNPSTLEEINLGITWIQTFEVGLYTKGGITANQLREKNNGHKS